MVSLQQRLYGLFPASLLPPHAASFVWALMTVVLPDPAGYGRILRDADGRVTGNVEHRDADPAQLAIAEVNTGILCARSSRLVRWLERQAARRRGGAGAAHAAEEALYTAWKIDEAKP